MEEADSEYNLSSWVLYGAIGFFGLYLIRRYFKGGQFTERVSAKGKIAVVTGANTGIGFETAKELNLKGAKVYMLCRSPERAEEARRRMVRRGANSTRLIFEQCDLSSFASVREAAEHIKKAEDHIDILVNNAAVMFYPKFELTKDGHEVTWQSNHLGPFLLTELLLPLLEKSEDARIINVSSKLHEKVKKPLDPEKMDDKKSFGFFAPYNNSKLANIYHARELSRRLRQKSLFNISVNSLHPGVCATELSRHAFFGKKPFTYLAIPLQFMFFKTELDGAQTTLYLALSKYAKGVTGQYFADCKRKTESSVALDDRAAEHLYNYSLQAVGLQ